MKKKSCKKRENEGKTGKEYAQVKVKKVGDIINAKQRYRHVQKKRRTRLQVKKTSYGGPKKKDESFAGVE